MSENVADNKAEEKVKEVEAFVQQMKAVETFRNKCLADLEKFYETTDPKLVEKSQKDFLKAVAESGLSLLEVGKEFRLQVADNFKNTINQLPRNKLVDIKTKNTYTAILLSLFGPIESFMESDEKRLEALNHIYFINAALRSIPIRYNGCKKQWDAEDAAVKEYLKK